MPRTGGLAIEILVDGEVETEYHASGGKTFIEMNLQANTSYDETYDDDTPHGREQSTWPVTPFQVW